MELDDLCIKIKIKFEFINTSSVFLRETSVLRVTQRKNLCESLCNKNTISLSATEKNSVYLCVIKTQFHRVSQSRH